MSKKRLLARGVIFSYGAIATQIVYSFASIPLALSYLNPAEFGMWSLITTISSYMLLADLGMTNGIMRHLLECKAGGDGRKYGQIFSASLITMGAISLIVLVLGTLAAFFSGTWFEIPEDLQRTYFLVMLLKTGLAAAGLATNMASVPLYVHHRQDLSQISQIVLFAIYFVTLYLGFRAGWGIYAMVANQAAGFIWSRGFDWWNCRRLGFYPKKGAWGLPERAEVLSVWRYSRDVFMIQMGGTLLNTMPQLLITRLLGLEAGAAWAVYTRPFAILKQILNRPFDVALPMIYEAYSRKAMGVVTSRWTEISQFTLAIAGAAFAVAAVNNISFVTLWTGGKIEMPASAQYFIAFYFYITVAGNVAFGSIGMDKKIGNARYTGFIQAVASVLLAIPATLLFSLNGLLLAISIPYLPGMLLHGIRCFSKLTEYPALTLAMEGMARPFVVMPFVAVIAWLCASATASLPGYVGLLLSVTCGFGGTLAFALTLGLSPNVKAVAISTLRNLIRSKIPLFSR